MKRIALLVLLATSCGEGSGVIELKFGHVGAPGSLFARSAEEFAARVNERFPERVVMNVFGASQLGGDEVMLQKLKLGTLDFALPSTIMSSTVDAFGVFEMPYLVESREHMERIEQDVVWPTLAPLAKEQAYEIIAVWENGFRHVTNNIRPIDVPADLEGVKLRTPRGLWRIRLFQAFGANPTPMPLSEVFVALQTGVMDGQENPFAQIYSSKLHEVQNYLSLTQHVYTPAFVTAGANRWGRLPEDVRLGIQEIARETQGFVYQAAQEMDESLLQELENAGLEVNTPDRDAFVVASEPIYDEFATSVDGGRTLIDAVRALKNP